MSRYTFICEHTDIFDEDNVTSKLTSEFRADDLNSVLEEFEMFLKGYQYLHKMSPSVNYLDKSYV